MHPFRAAAAAWLDEDSDPQTASELRDLLAKVDAGDPAAARDLTERFDGQLEFGTAGLRGILGAGPQRMNRVLVRRCAAGLAAHLLATIPSAATRGVVIGHDARHNSRAFAEDTARVLAAAGIVARLAHRPWPTPTTAWAITDANAAAGVMVTASHNPPAYNGYKVYWDNGAQIVPPVDARIAAEIAKVRGVPPMSASLDDPRIVHYDESLHDRYLAAIAKLRPRQLDLSQLVVAYTPLHGVGAPSVEPALAACQLHVEPSQRAGDPDFPTVSFPNPEEKGAMDRVVALGVRVNADVILANDPDADRLCCAVPDGAGGFTVLTGDQTGALLADYLLGATSGPRAVATTVVSSQLLGYLAKAAGATYLETLTGFKWIANAGLTYEREHPGGRIVLGYEEALGYSVGSLVRDKDGVSAALVFAELVAWNRAQGRSVLAHLDDIYRRVGLFATEQVSLVRPGAEGMHEIAAAMAKFRATPPTELAGAKIESITDLAKGEGGLPKSDVLVFRLAGGRRVIMRPSGTEPKLKSYYEVRVEVTSTIEAARAQAKTELAALRDAHQASI